MASDREKAFADGLLTGYFMGQRSDLTAPMTQRIVEDETAKWVKLHPLYRNVLPEKGE